MFEHFVVNRLVGVVSVLLIGVIFSSDRKKINIKNLIMQLLCLFLGAYAFLRWSVGVMIIEHIAMFFNLLFACAGKGIEFVFGSLALVKIPWGFIFGIKVLPVIIFFSAFVSLLYYWGIIQKIIYALSVVLRPVLGTNGAETLCVVANTFLGQTESPLLVRPYLANMSESEIFTIMVSGMATITCSLIAVYASLGFSPEHLLISSFLSIPAAILVSKLFFPQKSTKKDSFVLSYEKSVPGGALNAISNGAASGLNLCLNVGASLIVAIALLYFVNFGFGWLSSMIERFAHYPIELSVERIVGFLVWPFVWMLGIPSKLIGLVSGIVGLKIAINEMIAYTALVDIEISGLIKILLTYVLCGFTNFSSIGIQLGGIGAMEPSIKDTIAKLGMKALCASICVNFLIAFIIGLLLD